MQAKNTHTSKTEEPELMKTKSSNTLVVFKQDNKEKGNIEKYFNFPKYFYLIIYKDQQFRMPSLVFKYYFSKRKIMLKLF